MRFKRKYRLRQRWNDQVCFNRKPSLMATFKEINATQLYNIIPRMLWNLFEKRKIKFIKKKKKQKPLLSYTSISIKNLKITEKIVLKHNILIIMKAEMHALQLLAQYFFFSKRLLNLIRSNLQLPALTLAVSSVLTSFEICN